MLMKESNFSLCFLQDVQFLVFRTSHKFGYNCTDPNSKDQQQLYQNKRAKICTTHLRVKAGGSWVWWTPVQSWWWTHGTAGIVNIWEAGNLYPTFMYELEVVGCGGPKSRAGGEPTGQLGYWDRGRGVVVRQRIFWKQGISTPPSCKSWR